MTPPVSSTRRAHHPDRRQPPSAAGQHSVEITFPRRLDDGFAATWRTDLTAGIVVFLVALPLCLGIALASGAPLFAGIVTGVVGGVVVSWLSGSQLMVSGPAAGLTAIVFAAIAELGGYPAFLVAVVLAGLMQLALGFARAGIIGYFLPTSVIRGMLAAIGLILVLKQLPYALGAGISVAPMEAGTEPAHKSLLASLADVFDVVRPGAVLLAVLSLAILVAWEKIVPKAVRTRLPAPLVVVLLGVGFAAAASAVAPGLALPAEAMVQLPVLGSLAELAGVLSFPDWGRVADPTVWKVAITLALVASLETLLSLEATDKLDPYKRRSPANRELLAQGTGNTIAGLLGGLPMTGVIVRSAANINAGGRTRHSSFVHGVLLATAVLVASAWLNLIPLAVLAAILIHTGIKLASPRVWRDVWRVGPKYAVPFTTTVLAILLTDLLVGIGIGLAVGAFFVLVDSYRNSHSYRREASADQHTVRLTLAEEVTFLNKAPIARALDKVPEGSLLTVDGSRTRAMDPDVVELLHEFAANASARGITLRLVDIPAAAGAAAH